MVALQTMGENMSKRYVGGMTTSSSLSPEHIPVQDS